MHSKYPQRLEGPDVYCEKSVVWLRSAGRKAETEGFIMATKDQSLNTTVYKAMMIKDSSNPLCRLCHPFEGSIGHLISGCPVLAKTD